MTCSKLYVTKIKYSKSLQSQRTKGKIKTSFYFAVILLYIFVQKRHLILHPPPSLTTRHRRATKKLQFIGICYSLSFLLGFIAIY